MGGVVRKVRLDQLLVERKMAESREKAKRLIMAGKVLVNGQIVDKPGKTFPDDVVLELKEGDKYVSRGGYKLESAWKVFKFDVKGKVICDIGASTGGFTDFLLQNGAKRIYAVDVGKGQLHWKLRNDPRVVVMEKLNARYLSPEDIGEKVDFVTCDVSFISVRKIIPSIRKILNESGEVVILVKPQFEAAKYEVKRGLVLKKDVHKRVLRDIIGDLEESGFVIKGLTFSKIRGTKGNIEYFIYASLFGETVEIDISEVIEEAWRFFGLEGRTE